MEEDRYIRITLRIPRKLHAELDEVAEQTSKSLNAEIIGRLESSFDAEEIIANRRVQDAVHTAIQEDLAQYILSLYEVMPEGAQNTPGLDVGKNLASALLRGSPKEIQNAIAAQQRGDVTIATELLGKELYERRQYLESLRRLLKPRSTEGKPH